MNTVLIVIIIAIIAVGTFVLAMSITMIVKGHNLQSEIGENDNMKKLGIKCASHQIREEERVLRGDSDCSILDCDPNGCGSCGNLSHH